MKRIPTTHCLRAFCGLVVMTCSGWSFAEPTDEQHDDQTKGESMDVMWLVDPVRFRSFVGCGNSGEFSQPPQFGIVINEAGEVIEERPHETWGRQFSNDLVLLSTISSSDAIPERTIIAHDRRVVYESDLTPTQIGNGWLMCSNAGRFFSGRGQTKLSDGRVVNDLEYFYFDDQLERVEDVEYRLGIKLRANKLVGFVGPSNIPVAEEPGTRLQRIIRKDGAFSKNAFYQIDVSRRQIAHDSLVSAQAIPQRWLYDPVEDKKVLPIWYSMPATIQSDLLVLNLGEGELTGVFDAQLNRIADLGFRIQPAFVTSEDILVCVDRVQTDVVGHRVFKAYQVILEPAEPEADRLIELDVSWINGIELRSVGPSYGFRNSEDELVIVDAHLEPILTLDTSYDLIRVTSSGRLLVVNRDTHLYSYYENDGRLLGDFDVAAILRDDP